MNGYVAQRRGRFYAVIYEGRDPVTGKRDTQVAPSRNRPRRSKTPRRQPRRAGTDASRRGALADALRRGLVTQHGARPSQHLVGGAR